MLPDLAEEAVPLARHHALAVSQGTPVYTCHPRPPVDLAAGLAALRSR